MEQQQDNISDDSDHMKLAEEAFAEKKDVAEAAQLAKAALLKNPEDDRAYNLIGRLLQCRGSHLDAIANFNSAIQNNPTETDYYCNVIWSCLLSNMPKDALEYAEKALAIDPNDARANYLLGRYYYQFQGLEKAVEPLKKAIEQNNEYFEAYELLAMVYETLHELDKLDATIEKARAIDPANTNILLPSARLFMRRQEFDKAALCLEKIVSGEDNNPKWRVANAYHDLGRINDKQGNYDKAYDSYSKGQQLLKEINLSSGINLTMNYENITNLYAEWFAGKNLKDWPKERADKENPYPVFLIGFPRSGTTLAEQILAAHPNIVATDEAPLIDNLMKALPNFTQQSSVRFPQVLNKMDDNAYRQLRLKYNEEMAGLFEEDVKGKTAIDKMPLNIANMGFIVRVFPGAKFIMMLRDPRDACLSCFMQAFNHNTAMAEMYTLEGAVKIYRQTMDLYKHYKQVLQPDILEVKYEELLDDLEGHARKMLEFVGEPWDESVLRYYEKDKQRSVTTPSYEGVTKPIYKTSAGRWKNYEKYFADVLPTLEPYVRELAYEA